MDNELLRKKAQKVANAGSVTLAQLDESIILNDKIDTLIEETKKKALLEYDLQIDEETRAKLKGDKGDTGEHGNDGVDGKDGTNGKDGIDGNNGTDGKDGVNGVDGKDGINGVDGKDGSPDTAEEIRNKLESLEGDERLDRKAIKGLDKELANIASNITSIANMGRGTSSFGTGSQPVKAGNNISITQGPSGEPVINLASSVSQGIDDLLRTIMSRELTKGCTVVPKFMTYIDPDLGDDSYDGSVPVFTSGTTGPKKTAVVANWAGSPKTSIFSNEMLLFKGGTTYTHTETDGKITITSKKHIGAYYTEQNQAMPIINGTIYATGDVQDVIIQGVDVRPTTANQPCIHFLQTAAGNALNRVTIRGNKLGGGTINDATARGAIQIQYFNTQSTTTPYNNCTDILVEGNYIKSYVGHGILFGGAAGSPVGQENGKAVLRLSGNVANTETLVMAGVTTTGVSVIGATAGNFLIGSSTNATLNNLAGLINNPSVTSTTQVALSAGNQTLFATLGLKATVSGNVLTLETTAFYANCYLSDTVANGSWDKTYIETKQIWGGVDVINNTVEDCGAEMDCHAVSSYSAGVKLDKSSLTWTNTSGTIYYTDVSAAGLYGISVPSIDMVNYDTGSGTELFKLIQNFSTPTTPNPGEYGFDVATQRLYANANIVLSGTTRLSTTTRSAKGIRWMNNTLRRQQFNNILGGSAKEGHGVAFDDYTSYSHSINNVIEDMAGVAVTINRGDYNTIINNTGYGFVLGCVKGNFGWGNIIAKSTFTYNNTGVGYSDTVPGYKGYLHISPASTRLGVSSNDFSNHYSNIISHVNLNWTSSTTDVYAILGPTSSNAPPIMANNVTIAGSSGLSPTGARVVMSTPTTGLANNTLPINILSV
jgi:hypothetical protein